MNTPTPAGISAAPISVRWFMIAVWLAILAKCVLVAWAVERWHMPFHAAWIIVPTLIFAALATGLWLTHRES